MKSKNLIVFLFIAMMIGAVGCSKGEDEENEIQPISVETIGETDSEDVETTKTQAPLPAEESKDSAEAVKTQAPLPAEASKDSQEAESDPAREAYDSILKNLYQTYRLPDGTELGFDGILELSTNQFSVYDIDRDGREELIIVWTTTYTAGMSEIIYGFDDASGTVKTELFEYPMLTFYDNGVVSAGLSHNQGLAGEIADFWPYTLYQYDKNTDVYLPVAEVDAWNKAYYEKDYDDKPFPDEFDVDKDGILYQITVGDSEKLMDLEEYEGWRSSMIGGAERIEVPFVGMTQESIGK